MKENYMVCNCMQVSYGTILDALHEMEQFDDVLKTFDEVQAVTHCSTGCGGCHNKVMEIISSEMMGHK
ncbi:MAG: (2Fe-2S)-binding protein [Oscillospiraceae bacterium]|nr:(2Fe-2S)-binding protein [Oscillospiraceae bacterium]